jgi:hypothetical protein
MTTFNEFDGLLRDLRNAEWLAEQAIDIVASDMVKEGRSDISRAEELVLDKVFLRFAAALPYYIVQRALLAKSNAACLRKQAINGEC